MDYNKLFKVRDKRNKNWFYVDTEYINGYAKIFGPIGTAIYFSLCRHADNETQQCFPSESLIARELGTTRKTVRKYLKLFEEWKLVYQEKQERNKKGKWLNKTYWLIDKSMWKPSKKGDLPWVTVTEGKCELSTGEKSIIHNRALSRG